MSGEQVNNEVKFLIGKNYNMKQLRENSRTMIKREVTNNPRFASGTILSVTVEAFNDYYYSFVPVNNDNCWQCVAGGRKLKDVLP